MKRVTIILAALSMAACATQRYGRAIPVTDAERRVLTCDQIDLEIAKNDEFMKDMANQSAKFTGKDVLGFLGDFGIGNSMEYNEAMKSATTRSTQLRELQTTKNCTRTAVPAK